jgi:hypothetical protein
MTERQGLGRREADTDGHCGAHEQNTKDLTAMKNSSSIIKWILSLGVPVVFALWLNASNNMSANIKDIKSEIKALNVITGEAAVSAGQLKIQMSQVQEDVQEIKARQRR